MGCSGSKVDGLPLVIRCRERKYFIRAAADHRYALAAAYVAYFHSMKDVGDALRRFVEEELVLAASSSASSTTTSTSSPNLHSLEDKNEGRQEEEEEHVPDAVVHKREIKGFHGKSKSTSKGKSKDKSKIRSKRKGGTPPEEEESGPGHSHLKHFYGGDDSDSHLHVSSDESDDSHIHDLSDVEYEDPNSHHHPDPGPYINGFGYGYGPYYGGFGMTDQAGQGAYEGHPHADYPPGQGAYVGHHYADYPPGQGAYVGHGQAGQGAYSGNYPGYFGMNQPYQPWDDMGNFGTNFQNNPNIYYMKKSSPAVKTVIHRPEPVMNGYSNEYFGYPMQNEVVYGNQAGPSVRPEIEKRAVPPPPPSPKASAWYFINPFDEYENGYSGYGYGSAAGHETGSSISSPDSTEVRIREGIPDLEEETEHELYKKAQKEKERREEGNAKFSDGVITATSSSRGSTVAKTATSSGRGSRVASSHTGGEVPDSVPGSGFVGVQLHKWSEGSLTSVEDSSHKSSSDDGTNLYTLPKVSGSRSKKMPVPDYKGSAHTRQTPQQHNADTSRTVPSEKSERGVSLDLKEDDRSHETMSSLKSPVDIHARKKGVSFEVEESIKGDNESSKMSSFTAVPAHGSRDLREVVAEIRDEFAAAYDNGKEVAVMLDVGKLPYQPNIIRVILSRILYLISPSLSTSYPSSMRSMRLATKTMKLAKSYFGDTVKDIEAKPGSLTSTLAKLYEWEKKLYKEVKSEERLRVSYEKQRKRLKNLDDRGAESNKIDLARASIRKSQTRLNVCIKSIDTISKRIHKLRDEELQPQVAKLINGLIRMWRSMLRCHQKQFQAIKESKLRALRAKTDFNEDSTSRATYDLEMELRSWCDHFNNWISTQKAYVESLNGWLLQCLHYEPEETADGPVPFSPGRLGAPPIFVICHDWNLAMEAISETGVANAMDTFASSLRDLWERQDEVQRHRFKADDLSKELRNRLNEARKERGEKAEHDAISDKTGSSLVTSINGVSPLDDLQVDLDSIPKKRLAEEKEKHRDAIKLLNYAASNSVQGGLVPIFRALESFSMEALKAHEQVRLQSDDA